MNTSSYSGTDLELPTGMTTAASDAPAKAGGASVAAGGEVVVLGVAAPRSRATQVTQRVLDVVFSALMLLIFLPVFVAIALLIKFDSPGPVLFTQARVGKDGVEFPFYKFRSMVPNAEALRNDLEKQNERNGPVFKMRNDPRVTRVGRVLRRYSLDELPQLFNVLKGDMSLIGPRPALPREVALYTPRQAQRLAVMPGVTGLWQVSGRANISFERSVELDLHYIQHQSLGLNLRIMLMTIPAVLTGDGAH
ncbi:multidrug MFS transporter [Capsulimonas corticalis]|uniref:Multidrug MFS transporter n=1 Tax=Capsulimonas corticalis TaxID=2219043 RepID=A0A402D1S7_9BACT|nr:sugar transferase [Capsulimonas corticalis]BDI28737.1 multidrug MFS transporter [Capsulimonas corticalis]